MFDIFPIFTPMWLHPLSWVLWEQGFHYKERGVHAARWTSWLYRRLFDNVTLFLYRRRPQMSLSKHQDQLHSIQIEESGEEHSLIGAAITRWGTQYKALMSSKRSERAKHSQPLSQHSRWYHTAVGAGSAPSTPAASSTPANRPRPRSCSKHFYWQEAKGSYTQGR